MLGLSGLQGLVCRGGDICIFMHSGTESSGSSSAPTPLASRRFFCSGSSWKQLDEQKQALYVAISRPSVAVSLALSQAKGQGAVGTRLELYKQFSRIK